MKIYLVNKNPMITKLVKASSEKAGLELLEAEELDVNTQSDILVIDDDAFNLESFESYKANFNECKSIYIYTRDGEKKEGFDEYVQKPFLPTDFVVLLKQVGGIVDAPEIAQNDEINDENLSDDLGDLFQSEEENTASNILDEGDINEVKNLLDDTKETDATKEDDIDFDLDEIGLEEGSEKSSTLEGDLADDFDAMGGSDEKDLLEDLGEFDLDDDEAQKESDKKGEQIDLENSIEDTKEEVALEDTLKDLDTEKNTENIVDIELEEDESINEEAIKAQDLLGDMEEVELPQHSEESQSDEAKSQKMDSEKINGDDVASLIESSKDETQGDLSEMNLDSLDEKEVANALMEEYESAQESLQTQEDLKSEDISKEDSNVESSTQEMAKDDIDFSALNLEDMSEALGEPIIKEPLATPMVPANATQTLQANSIEGLITALQTLQGQNLKDLLSGATINISIQFPNKDKK